MSFRALNFVEANGLANSKLRILSIDGGGIRGILPAQVLTGLEQIIREESGNPKARVVDYFDLIAGTSTGGLLTCWLLSPLNQDDAQSAVKMFEELGPLIFRSSLGSSLNWFGDSYPVDGIENVLERQFGGLRLRHLIKPCLITAYETKRREPFLFRQHRAVRFDSHDFFVKDVARATSAAPTYFRPAQIESGTQIRYSLVDGGVFANNPAMCTLIEALALRWTTDTETSQRANNGESMFIRDFVMLSLGTGAVRQSYKYQDVKNFYKHNWIRPLIEFMMDGNADTVDYQIRKVFGSDTDPQVKQQYLRIDPSLVDADPALDDTSPENLRALSEAGRYAVEKHHRELRQLALKLIAQNNQLQIAEEE